MSDRYISNFGGYVSMLKKSLVLLSLFLTNLFGFTDYSNTMNDFMGCNQNMVMHMDGNNLYPDYNKAFRWLRDYISWSAIEKTVNDNYDYGGFWPNTDEHYYQCKQNGINVLMTIMFGNSIVGANDHFPKDNGSGYDEQSYRERSEFAAQTAARYGRKNSHPGTSIETADKFQGMDYVRYYEDFNEPDQWWEATSWPYDAYGWHVSSFNDGRNCTVDASHPIIGLKNGDPQAVHVMGGLAGANDTSLTNLLNACSWWTPGIGMGRFNATVQVLNYHQYATSGGGGQGYAPEHATYGLRPRAEAMIRWRNAHSPGKPVWITEFGWDTEMQWSSPYYARGTGSNPADGSSGSQLHQANYILRSFPLLKGWGIDKAFAFMYVDPKTGGTVPFESCGFIKDKANGFQKKISYYYMATFRTNVGHLSFHSVDKYAQGTPNVFSYIFRNQNDTHRVYMVWCRNGSAQVDDGTTTPNYVYAMPYTTTATQVLFVNGNMTGQKSAVTVNNAGTASASITIAQLTETPVLIRTHASVAFSPPLPTTLSARGVSTNKIEIGWQDLPNETSYTLFRNTSASTTGLTRVNGFPQNTILFTNSGLARNTTYYYYMRGYNPIGKSGYSLVSSAKTWSTMTPPSSTTLTLTAISTNRIDISWSDIPNEDNYKLYRSINSFTDSAVIVTLPQNSTSYSATGLQTDQLYYFWLKAINDAGVSWASSTKATLPRKPSVAPTLTVTSAIATNAIRIEWSWYPNITSYTLFRNTSNSTLGSIRMTGKLQAAQSFFGWTNTGLPKGTTYYYWVKVYNAAGGSPFSSPRSATTFGASIPPTDPTSSPTLQVISSNSIFVSWTPLANTSFYTVYRSTTDSVGSAVGIGGFDSMTTSVTNNGLLPGTTYYYWYRAFNPTGATAFSPSSSAKTISSAVAMFSNDIDSALAYPNPFQPCDGGTIKFINITEETVLEIYSVNNTLVWKASAADDEFINLKKIIWDGTNLDGALLAPGIYRYVLRDGKKIKSGKIVLLCAPEEE